MPGESPEPGGGGHAAALSLRFGARRCASLGLRSWPAVLVRDVIIIIVLHFQSIASK